MVIYIFVNHFIYIYNHLTYIFNKSTIDQPKSFNVVIII